MVTVAYGCFKLQACKEDGTLEVSGRVLLVV